MKSPEFWVAYRENTMSLPMHLNKSGDNNADLCILYLNLDNNYSKTLVTTQIDMSPSNCWALKLQKD